MQDYMNIGSEAMQAVGEYRSLLKSIEFELKISGGWLKPIRLKQLTGVLAQDRLEKQYEEDKKKNRNFILRSKIRGEAEGWRNYFSEDELKKAYARIQQGVDEVEDNSSGSDSEPSEDNIAEVQIIKTRAVAVKEGLDKNFGRTEENRSYSVAAHLKPAKTAAQMRPQKKERKSVEAIYPHTSRTGISALDGSVRSQTSSKMFSRQESRVNASGYSPMIFNTFRRNLGFYQQMLTAKRKLAHGSLEIMCTKLITAKRQPYK